MVSRTRLLLLCLCCAMSSARAWTVETSTWSGTSSGLWDLNGNWGGNVLESGDAVVFPANVSRKITQNDFLTTLTLGPITFNASDYVLNGNAIILAGGVFLNGANSDAEISLPMALSGSQAFTITAANSILTVSDPISGDGGITKIGSGWLKLLGNHTYSGGTIVEKGVLQLGPAGATLGNIPGVVQLGPAYLAGTGTVGGISSLGGAQVSPGDSLTIGAITSTGNVLLTAADALHFKVSTTQSDRLNVTGLIAIGSADDIILYFSPGINRAINEEVVLIQNDGDDAGDALITSAATPFLVNLLPFEGKHYQLDFVGDDGNDVVIRRVAINTSTTTLNKSPSGSIAYGGSVTFTATVSSTVGMTAGIPVVFRDGIRVIGTMNTNSLGVAALTVNNLPAGNRRITAMFAGDATRKPSVSDPVTQVVSGIDTSVGLVVTEDTAASSPVTLTATITTTGTPSGSMYFFDNGTLIGSTIVTSLSTAISGVDLVAGSHNLTAEFIGTNAYEYDDSNTVNHVVDGDPATTVLTSSANPAQAGNPITLMATVTSVVGTPSGSVAFKDGSTTIATKTLTGGSASLVTSGLSAGTHSLTAVYLGSAAHEPDASPALSQVVTAAPDGSGSGGNDVELEGGGCGLGSGTAALLFGLLMLLGLRLRRN